MKKTYLTPDILVVELDSESLCQVGASPTANFRVNLDTNPEDDETEAATYRSNLWN